MAARDLPNLGLKAFFDPGEDDWGDDMSLNLLKLSVLAQGGVLEKVAAVVGTPPDGDVYILDESHATNPNKIVIYDDGAPVYVVPQEGWLVYNRAEDYYEKFDGALWAELETGGGAGLPAGGTTGQALVKASDADGDAVWDDVAGGGGGVPDALGVAMTRANSGAIGDSVNYVVSWDTVVRNTDGIWTAGTPTKFIAPVSGWYAFGFSVRVPIGGGTHSSQASIFLNGAEIAASGFYEGGGFTGNPLEVTGGRYLNAGDEITFAVRTFGAGVTYESFRGWMVSTGGTKGEKGNMGGAWEVIANVQLNADGTFPAIDTTGFRTVEMLYSLQLPGTATDITAIFFRFNNDATSYYFQNGYDTNNSVGADGVNSNTNTGSLTLISSASGANPRLNASGRATFNGLDGPDNKGWESQGQMYRGSDGKVYSNRYAGFWNKGDVVTSINLTQNFAAGSSIQVIGIRADVAPGGGGSVPRQSFEPIQQIVAVGTESLFDIAIPAGYEDLLISFVGQATGAASPDLLMTVNGDHVAANYQSVTENRFGSGYLTNRIFTLPGTAGPAGYPLNGEIVIPSYGNGAFKKVASAWTHFQDNANLFKNNYGWRWLPAGSAAAAINTIRLALSAGLFAAGTRINIYGRRSEPQAFMVNAGLLGYAWSNTGVDGANSAAQEDVPGLSVTFNMPVAGVVEVEWGIMIGRPNGTIRIFPFIDGAEAPSDNPGVMAWHLTATGENGNLHGTGKTAYALSAGNHTIKLVAGAMFSTTPARYRNRLLTVRRLA